MGVKEDTPPRLGKQPARFRNVVNDSGRSEDGIREEQQEMCLFVGCRFSQKHFRKVFGGGTDAVDFDLATGAVPFRVGRRFEEPSKCIGRLP